MTVIFSGHILPSKYFKRQEHFAREFDCLVTDFWNVSRPNIRLKWTREMVSLGNKLEWLCLRCSRCHGSISQFLLRLDTHHIQLMGRHLMDIPLLHKFKVIHLQDIHLLLIILLQDNHLLLILIQDIPNEEPVQLSSEILFNMCISLFQRSDCTTTALTRHIS